MQNRTLSEDYLIRCENRLAAVQILYERHSWADVVRESQEIVELALKALLMSCNIEVPRIHDVSQILLDHVNLLPQELQKEVSLLSDISREMRRDRELAFYGSEDITPSNFYREQDAEKALKNTKYVVVTITRSLKRK